ncbi:MAG: hypothetical protein KGS47_05380 [Chloroflexi bacterium]|nr:hypothetical protein [Chloroflexota bacterium]
MLNALTNVIRSIIPTIIDDVLKLMPMVIHIIQVLRDLTECCGEVSQRIDQMSGIDGAPGRRMSGGVAQQRDAFAGIRDAVGAVTLRVIAGHLAFERLNQAHAGPIAGATREGCA